MIKRKYTILLARVVIILGILFAWEATVKYGVVNIRLVPPPSLVYSTLTSLIASGILWEHLIVTLLEVFVSFIISVPLGIITGLLLARQVHFEKIFGSFIYLLVSVPKSVFLPIFVLTLGIGFKQKVAFGVAQAFFIIAINTATAVANVQRELILVGKSCGANTWQLYTKIYIPAMIPIVLVGVRLGIIFIITGVILAEMYVAKNGLGWLLSSWVDTFQMPEVFAIILVASMISIIINEMIRFYEKKVSQWRI